MSDIQKKTYIDKDETDSMEKNKQMKKHVWETVFLLNFIIPPILSDSFA